MRQRKRESHTLHADELGACYLVLALAVTRFFQNLIERTHPLGFLQEEPDRLFKVMERLLLGSAAGRQVEFARVCQETLAFLEDLGSELNLHMHLGYSSGDRNVARQRGPGSFPAGEDLLPSGLERCLCFGAERLRPYFR